MNNIYLITESPATDKLLAKLLPAAARQAVQFVQVNDRYSALSMARSILSARRAPVVAVLDAATSKHALLYEQEITLREAIGAAAAGIPFEVLLAVPEWEVVLLEAPQFTANASPTERALAHLQPQQFLQLTYGETDRLRLLDKLFKKLDEPALARIRAHPLLAKLMEFLSSAPVRLAAQAASPRTNGTKPRARQSAAGKAR